MAKKKTSVQRPEERSGTTAAPLFPASPAETRQARQQFLGTSTTGAAALTDGTIGEWDSLAASMIAQETTRRTPRPNEVGTEAKPAKETALPAGAVVDENQAATTTVRKDMSHAPSPSPTPTAKGEVSTVWSFLHAIIAEHYPEVLKPPYVIVVGVGVVIAMILVTDNYRGILDSQKGWFAFGIRAVVIAIIGSVIGLMSSFAMRWQWWVRLLSALVWTAVAVAVALLAYWGIRMLPESAPGAAPQETKPGE